MSRLSNPALGAALRAPIASRTELDSRPPRHRLCADQGSVLAIPLCDVGQGGHRTSVGSVLSLRITRTAGLAQPQPDSSNGQSTEALLSVSGPFGRHGPEQNSTTIQVAHSAKSTTTAR